MIRFPSLEFAAVATAQSPQQQQQKQQQQHQQQKQLLDVQQHQQYGLGKMHDTLRAAAQSMERKASTNAPISSLPSRRSTTATATGTRQHNRATQRLSEQPPIAGTIPAANRSARAATMIVSRSHEVPIDETPDKLQSANSTNPLERRAARQRIGLGKRTSNSALVGNDAYDACASHSVGIQLALSQVMRKHSTAVVSNARLHEVAEARSHTGIDGAGGRTRQANERGGEKQLRSAAGDEAAPIGHVDPDRLASTQHLVVCLTQLRNAVLPMSSSSTLLQALTIVEQSLFSHWYRPTTEQDEKQAQEMQQFARHHAGSSVRATEAMKQRSSVFENSMTQLTNAEVVLKLEKRILDNEADAIVEQGKLDASHQETAETAKLLEEANMQIEALERKIRKMAKEHGQLDERLERLRDNAVDSADEYKILEGKLLELKDEAKQARADQEKLLIEKMNFKNVKEGLQKHVQEKCEEIRTLGEKLKQVDELKRILAGSNQEKSTFVNRCRASISRRPLLRVASESSLCQERRQQSRLEQQRAIAQSAKERRVRDLAVAQRASANGGQAAIGSALFSVVPTPLQSGSPRKLVRRHSASDVLLRCEVGGESNKQKGGRSTMVVPSSTNLLRDSLLSSSIEEGLVVIRPCGGKLPAHKERSIRRLVLGRKTKTKKSTSTGKQSRVSAA